MIRALVVDDEAHARRTLRTRLDGEPDVEVVGECGGGEEAVDAIREERPDVVFLDIRMPGVGGFEVLERLERPERPHVVFVTAFDEYALQAFEVHALAYLLKPFDDVRFAETMDHVRRLLSLPVGEVRDRLARLLESVAGSGTTGSGAGTASPASREGPADRGDEIDRFVVRSGRRTVLVDVDDVDWIEASGDYAALHCGRETHLVTRTMTELAERLPEGRFVRVHRSAIVNLDRVVELRTDDGRDYTVLLESGARVRMSRTYRSAMEEALGDRL